MASAVLQPFRLQPSRRLQPSSEASVLALEATWATDLNTDLGCCWDMDPDIGLTHKFDLVNIVAPSGNPGNSDQDGSGSSLAQGHQQDHRLWPNRAVGINRDPGYCRTRDHKMVLGSSPSRTSWSWHQVASRPTPQPTPHFRDGEFKWQAYL